MRKKTRDPEVPYVIELHPGLWCDSEKKKFIDDESKLTERVSKPDFAVIKELYLAYKQSPTGIASVSTKDLVDVRAKVTRKTKTGKKKVTEKDKIDRFNKYMSGLNGKFIRIHGHKIFAHNGVREEWRFVLVSECETCSQKIKEPSTKGDQRSPTTPPSL